MKPRLRAVAYLRKSTRDQQENSIFNQRKAIDAFAERHEISIVKYFVDDGISGLTMEKRNAFMELINDYVKGGKIDFSIILVLDVTRWGRFQDIDESAHLEYTCRKHGKEIIYVTEGFKNDNSIMDSVIKSIKRAMAAEYSKNLGEKVLAGSLTIASQGYRLGGIAPYGYNRLRLDQNKEPVGVLKPGQRKAIANERVSLTPGDDKEVNTVRDIFRKFTEDQLLESRIAVELNERKRKSPSGGKWTENSVRMILKNETYAGTLVYNRQTQRLKGPSRKNPRDKWIIVPEAFEAVISPEQYVKAQALFKERSHLYTDSELLEMLQRLFEKHGKLSGLIIESMPRIPASSTFRKRFGSLINAYKLVGYIPPQDYRFIELKEIVKEVSEKVIMEVIETLEKMGHTVIDCGSFIRLNDQLNIDIVSSSIRNKNGKKKWAYKFNRKQDIDITIAVRLADDEGGILDYYFFPLLAMEMDKLFVAWNNGVYLDTFRFENLDYFFNQFGDYEHFKEEAEYVNAED